MCTHESGNSVLLHTRLLIGQKGDILAGSLRMMICCHHQRTLPDVPLPPYSGHIVSLCALFSKDYRDRLVGKKIYVCLLVILTNICLSLLGQCFFNCQAQPSPSSAGLSSYISQNYLHHQHHPEQVKFWLYPAY